MIVFDQTRDVGYSFVMLPNCSFQSVKMSVFQNSKAATKRESSLCVSQGAVLRYGWSQNGILHDGWSQRAILRYKWSQSAIRYLVTKRDSSQLGVTKRNYSLWVVTKRDSSPSVVTKRDSSLWVVTKRNFLLRVVTTTILYYGRSRNEWVCPVDRGEQLMPMEAGRMQFTKNLSEQTRRRHIYMY